MHNNLKHLGILMVGPIILSLVWQASAQTISQTDSSLTAQNQTLQKNVRIAVLDSTGFSSQNLNRHLLFTPQDKKRFNFRDLLLRPQDRHAIMIHPVQDILAQSDSTK